MPYVTIQTKVKKIVRRGAPGPISSDPDPTLDSLTFNTAAAIPDPADQGQLWWDEDEETLSFKQDGAILQLGQELQWHVRNNSGVDIADGVAVMATGSIGASGRITISKMDGTDPLNARLLLGITTESIPNGEDGKVTVFGKIRGINTTGIPEGETWLAGDILWISDSISGQLTKTEPSQSTLGMPVAFVITVSATVGTIAVRVTSVDEHLTLNAAQNAAIDASNSPGGSNAFATIADIILSDANKVAFIENGTPPVDTPTGGGYLYVNAGALKYKGSSGTITTLGLA
jgi:hypothetical protein